MWPCDEPTRMSPEFTPWLPGETPENPIPLSAGGGGYWRRMDGWMDIYRTYRTVQDVCKYTQSLHSPVTFKSTLFTGLLPETYNQSITAATWCIQACRRGDDDLLRCRLSARLAVKSGLTWIGMRWTWWLVPDSLSVSQTAEDWLQNRNYPVSKMYEE